MTLYPTLTLVDGCGTRIAGLHCSPNLLAVLTECRAIMTCWAKWWADVVKPTRTRLYIGIAFYKVGEPSKIEPDWMINGGVPES